MINKAILVGNLGKEPNLKTTSSGKDYLTMSVATNESYMDNAGNWQNITEWHNVVIWDSKANPGYVKRLAAKLGKGDSVWVEGKITTRSYEHEGYTKYITEIVANSIRLVKQSEANAANRNSNHADHSEPNAHYQNSVQREHIMAGAPAEGEPVNTAEIEDLPF